MDTTTGRFTSMDSYLGSVDDPVSLHKYLYANANPVNYIDPTGYNSYGEMNLALKIQLILTDITTLKINMYCWYIRLGEASIGGKILKEVIDESFELLLEGDVDIYSIMWTGVEVVYGLANSEKEFSMLKNNNSNHKIRTGAHSSGVNSSGNGLGKLANKELNVSEKGLNIVKNHINQFETYQPNVDMIRRLENAMKNGEKITGADASFYMHELAESYIMEDLTKTMDFESAYDIAHSLALSKYEVSQFSVYHPEVIANNSSQFSLAWKRFWEENK